MAEIMNLAAKRASATSAMSYSPVSVMGLGSKTAVASRATHRRVRVWCSRIAATTRGLTVRRTNDPLERRAKSLILFPCGRVFRVVNIGAARPILANYFDLALLPRPPASAGFAL